MTSEEFEEKTGSVPINDDLDRVNCEKVGQVGHECCGWCIAHDGPQFVCGCNIRRMHA